MTNKGKYLAIDFGDRRVGLAVSDFDKRISFPRENIAYRKTEELIEKIRALCEEEQIIKVILGLPIEMDGAIGERFIKTQEFGAKLKKSIGEIPIEYFDERLTTKRAKQLLHEQGFKAREQKGQRDMISAQVILDAYLDSIQ